MNNLILIISGVIVLIGIFLFFFFIYKSRKLKNIEIAEPEPIKHYKKIRDKLTVREEEPEEEYSPLGLSNITGFFMFIVTVAIILIIAIYIMNNLSTSLNQNSNDYNVTNSMNQVSELLEQTSVFFPLLAIAIIIGVILTIVISISRFGGGDGGL